MIHLGWRLFLRNELAAARAEVDEALRLYRLLDSEEVADALIIAALMLVARGDVAGAESSLQQAEHILRKHNLYPDVQPLWDRARVTAWLAQDRLAEAVAWLDARRDRLAPCTDYAGETHCFLAAAIWIEQGRRGDRAALDRAIDLLDRFMRVTAAAGHAGNRVPILVLLAAALHLRGRPARAETALRTALTLAQPERLTRCFIDGGRPIAELLAGLQGGTAEQRAFSAEILAALGAPAEVTRPAAIAEPLSARELEVLQLLCQGR